MKDIPKCGADNTWAQEKGNNRIPHN